MDLSSLAPGTYLAGGRFQLVRVLGQGSMGTVVEVIHATLGTKFALKVMRLEGHAARTDEARTRFLREARIATELSSEHIVAVHDVGTLESGEPFIVMDLLVGQDLAALSERTGVLPVPYVIDLVLQVCEGLALVHAAGHVHRDIKPANLFVTHRPSGEELVKILDLGLMSDGRNEQRLTSTVSSFGSPAYMSPEQVMSARNVDARSDQHSLAVTLFELLTKRLPFAADSAAAAHVLVATQPAPPMRSFRPDLPPSLDAVVQRALAKSADQRFPDVGAFAMALAPFGGPKAASRAEAARRVLDRSGASVAHTGMSASTDPSGSLAASPLVARARVAAVVGAIAGFATVIAGWRIATPETPPAVVDARVEPAPTSGETASATPLVTVANPEPTDVPRSTPSATAEVSSDRPSASSGPSAVSTTPLAPSAGRRPPPKPSSSTFIPRY